MQYKTIVVYADHTPESNQRIDLAARLALHEQAHLIALVRHDQGVDDDEQVTARVSAIGPIDLETQIVNGDASVALQTRSMGADLLIMGQPDSEQTDLAEYVALNAACPVLMVPQASRVFTLGDRILIGWNGSQAAARAVRDALPFLRLAQQVFIGVFDGASQPVGSVGAETMVDFLARHGVRCGIIRRRAHEAGAGLQSLAADLTSDLLVMGCMAHPHLPDRYARLKGGATRFALEGSNVPVLMSH